jgi:hypothetical protein
VRRDLPKRGPSFEQMKASMKKKGEGRGEEKTEEGERRGKTIVLEKETRFQRELFLERERVISPRSSSIRRL